MKVTEVALHAAAENIPDDIGGRFQSLNKLSTDDRTFIIELARDALAPFGSGIH
jgi:hypothetical protein